jgi:hypothetical protein
MFQFDQKEPKPMSLAGLAPQVHEHLRLSRGTTFPAAADYVLQQMRSDLHDPKTIRRRVYDILNVFLACDLIEKSKAEIRLKSLPSASIQSSFAHSPGYDSMSNKKHELTKKINMLVLYHCVINRNRCVERPAGTFQLSVIFVGFDASDNGTTRRSLDGKSLVVASDSPPVFFSPMDVLEKLTFSSDERRQVIRGIGIDPPNFAE